MNRFCVCSLLLAAHLIGCARGPSPPPELSPLELRSRYLEAVADARVRESVEISHDLTAITPENEELIWTDESEEPRVLVVTWTRAERATGETWVTAAPELQQWCAEQWTGDEAAMVARLEQVLGLPPDNRATHFYGYWVDPDDLFRPSPDPEITDQAAELMYDVAPQSHERWIRDLGRRSYNTSSDWCRLWLQVGREAGRGPMPYPWTALGYTYDWGGEGSEVGLSEFVIREGASTDLEFALSNAEFFAEARRSPQ